MSGRLDVNGRVILGSAKRNVDWWFDVRDEAERAELRRKAARRARARRRPHWFTRPPDGGEPAPMPKAVGQ
ncbi:MAG: hypothetical protein AB7R77_05945 [Ilumatobacteraceae bacterium]